MVQSVLDNCFSEISFQQFDGTGYLVSDDNFRKIHTGRFIYPNPANDYIVIDYKLDKPYNKLVLQITDPTGKIVLSQDLKGGQNEELIYISTLKPGVYNASVKGDGKVMSTVKLTVLSK